MYENLFTYFFKLEIVVEVIYGLHPNKYLQILNLKFGRTSLVTRHFGLDSDPRSTDEIKDLHISIATSNLSSIIKLLT